MGCAHSSSHVDPPRGDHCRRPEDTSPGVEHAAATDAGKTPATAAGGGDVPADPFEVDPLVLELHSNLDVMRRRSVGRRVLEPTSDRRELRLARAARAAQMGGMTDNLFQFVAEDLLPPDDPEADERLATWLVQQRDVIQLPPPVLPVLPVLLDDDDHDQFPVAQVARDPAPRRRSSALVPFNTVAFTPDDRHGSFARRPAHGMSFDLSLDEASASTSLFGPTSIAAGASRVNMTPANNIMDGDNAVVVPGLPTNMPSCADSGDSDSVDSI